MIVDASALVAILDGEDVGPELLEVLLGASSARIPAPAFVEAAIVLDHRRQGLATDRVEAFLRAARVQVMDFTAEHARVAHAAYRRYGRGSGHPARLNYGDALVYAVATVEADELLFTGEDFAATDVRPARP